MTGPFDYNDKPTPAMIEKMNELRADFKALAEKIDYAVIAEPRSRGINFSTDFAPVKYMAKAIESLEIAAMFANKAITHTEEEKK